MNDWSNGRWEFQWFQERFVISEALGGVAVKQGTNLREKEDTVSQEQNLKTSYEFIVF
jgi:hypothetical protein